MATTLQFRRGTTAEVSGITGANGELIVDASKKVVTVHDGTTAGGIALITEANAVSLAANAYSNATSYTDTAIANLVDGAPAVLDTLNEIALALGNDENFAVTISNQIANGYSNATSYADLVGNTTYANATSYADEVGNTAYTNATSFASNADNISSGTLDEGRLPTSGVTANTYGSASLVPVLTIDATGRITNAEAVSVAGVANVTFDSSNNILTVDTADGGSFTADFEGLYTNVTTIASNATTITSGTLDEGRLPTSGVVANTYGSASLVPVITVDETGRITNAESVSVAGVANVSFDSANNILTVDTADGGSFTTDFSGLYTNATSYADGVTNTAYSNATSYADEVGNTAYSNAVTFASNADNISSGTLDTGILPDTIQIATEFSVGNSSSNSTLTVAGLITNSVSVSANIVMNNNQVTGLGTPTNTTDAATKEYVDTLSAASLHYHDPVRVEAPSALTASYNNGTAGVGATLTNSDTQAALVIDGVTLDVADRVLVYQQANSVHNGVYAVTDTGNTSTNWVLTRTTDTDSYGASDADALGQGDAFYVKEGDTGAGELYVMNTEGTITFGTTEITFAQISSAQIYSAGSFLNLDGTQFSVNATSANTASTVVARDASGNFSAGTITATLSGTASLATNALVANTVTVEADNSSSSLRYVPFVDSTTGNQRLNTDTQLYYRPSDSTLWVTSVQATNFYGTASTALVANQVSIDADNTTNANMFIPWVNATTGNKKLYTDNALYYNPALNILYAGIFSGTATAANTVIVEADNTTNATRYITFVDSATGTQRLNSDTGLTYNPSSNTLTTTTFSGALNGNASTATKLASARTIGGVSFDGSANINLPGVNTTGNQDTSGNAATATKLASARTIGGVSFDGSANINLPGVNTTGNQNTTGSAATLTTGRTIGLSGDVTATGVSFDGSANITLSADIAANVVGASELNVSGNGTSGQALLSDGDGSFSWGSAGATLSNDTTTDASYYLAMSNTSSGSLTTAYISSSKLYFNPSSGTLSAVIFNSFSDESLKDNVNTLTSGLDVIKNIRPVEFTWKENGSKSFGVIAQEIEQILPEIVSTNNEGIKSVAYSQIIAFLIDAVKQLDEKIDSTLNK